MNTPSLLSMLWYLCNSFPLMIIAFFCKYRKVWLFCPTKNKQNAAAISAGVGSSVTGDIKVSGTTYYKWIKFPTRAFYRVETTIKMGNTIIDEDVIEYEADANHGGDVAPK